MAVLWKPAHPERTELHRLIQHIQQRHDPSVRDYPSMHRWSVENYGLFWREFIDFAEILYQGSTNRPLEAGENFQSTKFFPEIRINMAENLLRHMVRDCTQGNDKRLRMVFQREDGKRRYLSSGDIIKTVYELQQGMKSLGIMPGDRVATYLPNIPETMMVMMAALSIGAVFSSSSPDFGAQAVLDRFRQIQPAILFATDAVLYRGRVVSKVADLQSIVTGLPELKQMILIPFDEPGLPDANSSLYSDFIAPFEHSELHLPEFIKMPFSHPVYIMYSSGTTGLPKCMVQGAGVLLNHLKELILHTDLREKERIFYFTTCGWMMWNWLASSLATGATPVLYDGHPFTPDPVALWRMAADLDVNVFGTSAGYLSAFERSSFEFNGIDISQIRLILSTGSPLLPEQFDFVYRHIKSDAQLSSISGGTDLNGCFVLGNPLLPVNRGEIQCAGLAMDVDVVDENGEPVPTGVEGELICRHPFPSQPLYFWNDTDGDRYRAAYFEAIPGVWRHGDFIVRTENGGFRIEGRSDATLNPGGVRIGTADLYRVVDGIPEVADSLVIGPTLRGQVKVLLFVAMRSPHEFSEAIISKIRRALREKASPRHVPDRIFAVTEIPYTRNMKKVEIAVRNIFEQRPVTNREALANADCLEEYMELARTLEIPPSA